MLCGPSRAKTMKWLWCLRPHVPCCPTSTRDPLTMRCEFRAVRQDQVAALRQFAGGRLMQNELYAHVMPAISQREKHRQMSGLRASLTLPVFLSIWTLACGQPLPRPAPPAAARAAVSDTYCWWTLLRTALPPDAVAQRFKSAYQTLGLGNVSLAHSADTAWARAGPSILEDDSTGASYASTAIAVRQGDSTSFRYFVEITRPSSTASRAPDRIEFCAKVAKATGIAWSRPQRRPNSSDSLSVFMREALR
jgi:hypothetical protein